jgi:hypothetical protein
VAYLFGHRFLLRGVVSKFVSVAFIYQASNAQMITVLRVLGVLEDGMEHHVQVLLALSISSALCLAAWIWARRRLIRFQASVDRHERV